MHLNRITTYLKLSNEVINNVTHQKCKKCDVNVFWCPEFQILLMRIVCSHSVGYCRSWNCMKILHAAIMCKSKEFITHRNFRHLACICFESFYCCISRLFRFPRYAFKNWNTVLVLSLHHYYFTLTSNTYYIIDSLTVILMFVHKWRWLE